MELLLIRPIFTPIPIKLWEAFMQLKPDTITFTTPDWKLLSEMSLKSYTPGKISAKLLSLTTAYPGEIIIVYKDFTRLAAEDIQLNNL